MIITFKFLLNKRRATATNEYPLILRVYKGASYNEHSLNIKLPENDWDGQSQQVLGTNPLHEVYNAKILADKSKLQKLILLAELNEETDTTPGDIIAGLKPKVVTIVRPASHSIIKYGQGLISKLTASGKVGNAFVYSCAINKLKSYVKSDKFSFESLTYKKLNEFSDSMLADGIKVNTVSVYMRTIRAIYNKAIKEGLVSATAYPFNSYRIKNEKTINRALTLAELKAIASVPLQPGTAAWHWRNYFLLSFCLIGINFADLLTLTGANIIDGRITFRRKKTGKIYSIKLTEAAGEILRHYTNLDRPDTKKLLLPVLKQTNDLVKLKKDIWQAIKTCNSYLRKLAEDCSINKPVTTYYARYSFAGIAKSLGYSKDMIAEALGHEYGNRVTGIYYLRLFQGNMMTM